MSSSGYKLIETFRGCDHFAQAVVLYGAETWTIHTIDHKHLESFEMWCWRRMEKISWTDHVRNEEVLLRVKDKGISYMK
jgi:hypothetical protein